MSIGRVVFVPSAPLLIPAVAAGSAGLDEGLREASLAAVRWAVGDVPNEVIVVASVAIAGESLPEATWDFHGFGVPRTGPDRPRLPWQLGIGAWLLEEAGWTGARRYLGVAADQPSEGHSTGSSGNTALVVVGDGSACRTEKAPGYFDERAESFDAQIAGVLAAGDIAGLAGLDAELAAELLCAGWPAWRAVSSRLGGAEVSDAELVAHVAPYGVAYFVARWTVDPAAGSV